MIDHVGFKVADYARSKAFYQQLLGTLGYSLLMEITPEMTGTDHHHGGFGSQGKPAFWIGDGMPSGGGLHVAVIATNRSQVDAFHATGLAAGGRDNGAPGLRPHYHANYYGAFILDPDGHNIEAVCHLPE